MLWMEEDEVCFYHVFVTKKEPRKRRKRRKTRKEWKRWEHDMSGEENGTTEGAKKTEETERTEEMKLSL